jgi:antibiotic biosynthesis monooxygenase (ABM) superfamily enzyme
MASLAVAFTVRNLDTQTNALKQEVQSIQFEDAPSAAERLRRSPRELRERAEKLKAIHSSPLFDSLPAEQQQLVRDRLDELKAYLDYLDRLRQSPRPQDVHTERALREVKENLRTVLAVPRAEWKETDAGRLHEERVQDAEGLDTAVKRARNWYLDSVAEADGLWTFKGEQTGAGSAGINWDRWTPQVEAMLKRRPPFTGSDKVSNTATTLTYDATVLRFEEVQRARADWEEDQSRLRRLLDLTAALGLAPSVQERPPVLVIPRQITLAQARERSKALAKAYPTYQGDFVLDRVPEAIRPQVRQAARTNYEHLLEPARAAVLSQLQQAGGGAETRAHWEGVRTWLRAPAELDGWRVIAGLLVRLNDAEAADPVTALAEFLAKTSFPLDLRRLTLEIPESLGVKPAADAVLSIHHPASAGEKPALVFEQSGEGERDAQRRVWVYSYRPAESQRLTYRPGDSLWASLPLRDDLMFTWVRGHSLMYQFERLTRPPRLHKAKEAAVMGTLEEKVHLTITPADGVPRLPDLMPVVRLQVKD